MTSRTIRDHLVEAPSTRLLVVFWGGLATIDLARAGQAPAAVQVALLGALATACAVGQHVGTALAVAGTTWLVMLGFVVHEDGALTPAGPADALRLAGLLAVTALVSEATR